MFKVDERKSEILNRLFGFGIQARFIARQTRQGWERLCGEAKAVFFVPAAGARSARDHGAGFTKTGFSQAAFERTARQRHVNAGGCESAPSS